jgi:hypothetical protein
VAIAAVPGRLVPSGFGPTEVVFDLTDGRPWYVPQVIADEIYAAGIQARQQIEVTATGRKKTEVRIVPVQARIPQRVPERVPERDYTPELERSLHQVAAQQPSPAPSKTTAAAACMMASMCSAVDAIIEVQAYATRKGMGLTFSEESVRAIGLSIYIDACRNGGPR